ncbi:hypothetical protein ABZ357_16155 [Streptomyces sp. NPDC005917]|uniref:hypothetical protein n=1 Tax=unclassified Streptomyces TaxID=2593676 RepID=UPI0033F791E1
MRAVNAPAARWAAASQDGTVFSAAGVWPPPAFPADGRALAEPAGALGLPAEEAAGPARELLGAMAGRRGLDTAPGVWAKRTPELREASVAGPPADAHGVPAGDEPTDHEALDAWAGRRTGGLVDRMPVSLDKDTELVLGGASAMRTRRPAPFQEWPLDTGAQVPGGQLPYGAPGPGLRRASWRRR